MNGNFAISLAHVLVTEGGRVDDPKDPGGRTAYGITQRSYDAWRHEHGLPQCDVWDIDQTEIPQIYRENYWNKVAGDELPAGVDYSAFDFAVNSGPHEADVCLQRALQALQNAAGVTADGIIGPKTLAALSAADPRWIIHSICAERLAFMREHCDWADYSRGWSARVASVEMTARGMAA